MSAEQHDLGDLLNDALGTYLAEHGGGFVTAFHLAVEFVDQDGEPSWMYATAPAQRMATTLGLIEWSRGVAAYEQQRYLDGLSNG